MHNLNPKEVIEEATDIKYEFFRAIKTFCIIMIIFCAGFLLQKEYNTLLENSKFLKFYPLETLYYEDFADAKDFKRIKLQKEYPSLGYGIFKDNRGNDKFLIVAKTNENNTHIIDTKEYSYFVKNGYAFLSNDNKELENIQQRLKIKDYEFLKNKNIKQAIKKLSPNRDFTIMVNSTGYANLEATEDTAYLIDRILDKAVIQVFKENDNLIFDGEISFENDLATFAVNLKRLSETFVNRKIKIENFNTNNRAVVLGVKDFDLWTQFFVNVLKNLPQNQYSETLALMQNIFNTNVENDIVKKLNGNAVFYLHKTQKDFHPMITVETKRDIASQAQKYFSFLQLSNSLKVSEKEINNKSLNILSSKFYPYNLIFGTINDKMFLLGHQDIIENYTQTLEKTITPKKSDFYFFADINKFPNLKENFGFWKGFSSLEIELSLTPLITFSGKMSK